MSKVRKKLPRAVQLDESLKFDSYIVVGLFKNFNGFSKANFVSDASITNLNEEELANYKLQDYYYSAHHFSDLQSAINIAEKYYMYYETKSQLFSVYGIENNIPKLIWYQDGFFEYIGESTAIHGENWFYGIISCKDIKSQFSIDSAPIILKKRKFDNGLIIPCLLAFPRESILVQFQDNEDTADYVFYFENANLFNTILSRLMRIYCQTLKNQYDESTTKRLIPKYKMILKKNAQCFKLTDYGMNEKEVPAWVRGLVKYGKK